MLEPYVKRSSTGAYFSNDRVYRYTLWRQWPSMFDGPVQLHEIMAVIGLNPSTADATKNDPTIRRCIQFSKDWGFKGLLMMNAFAFRDTSPDVMKKQAEPIGPDNDYVIHFLTPLVGRVLIAWGNDGDHLGRDQQVLSILERTYCNPVCLGITKKGQPLHPLYVRATIEPQPWIFS